MMTRPNMKHNTQPVESVQRDPFGSLEVHHLFSTIQGEGPFSGSPAVFLRLSGCNLQCPHCDTDYTSHRARLSPGEILAQIGIRRSPPALIVITGGEPFRQNLGPVVRILHQEGYNVQIETNGTLFDADFDYHLATIVCSPKTGKVNPNLEPFLYYYKYVVEVGHTHPHDGLPTRVLGHETRVARPKLGEHLTYIQPADEQDPARNAANLREAIAVCLKFNYRLCLQLQKIINLE